MAVTSYHTVEGQILGQTASGVRTQYLTDTLGSITCTIADDGSTLNTYRYKPYGAQLSKTGVAADPKFQWVGGVGYRLAATPIPSHYVRARHYGGQIGSWSSVDPLWPAQSAYSYGSSNPVSLIDPSGLIPAEKCCCCPVAKQPLYFVKLRGLPSGHVTTYTEAQKKAWRGYLVAFRFKMRFFKKPNIRGACTPWDHEDIRLNGVLSHGLNFWDSSLAQYWKACLRKNTSDNCDAIVNCVIYDEPGATNVDFNGNLVKLDYILRKEFKIFGGDGCDCGEPLTWEFLMHIQWKTLHTGDPDIWTP